MYLTLLSCCPTAHVLCRVTPLNLYLQPYLIQKILAVALDNIPTGWYVARMAKITTGDSRTKLLNAALTVFRQRGYTATTVDDLCQAAQVTKGSFFHHFKTKEELTIAAVEHWNSVTGQVFESAAYQQVKEPRARLLAYIAFRDSIITGELAEFTCLLGTLVQETFQTHPSLQHHCQLGIQSHALTLLPTIKAAKILHAPKAKWSPRSLAFHIQAVLQGAFVLAKASGDAAVAHDCVKHLQHYVELLLPPTETK